MARTTHSRTAAGAILSALVLAFAYACSNYGDGERCDSRGNNLGQDDCQDGLVCTTAAARGDIVGAPDLCCPVNRDMSVSAACKSARQTGTNFSDGGTVVDTGIVVPNRDASSSDASSDAAEGG